MKRVLLIGEHSYIGTKFVEYMLSRRNRSEEIAVTSVGARSGQWKNMDFSGFDTVLHLAGLVHKKETQRDIAAYREINHHMAIEVAKKSRKAGVSQFIFMSTAAVYGGKTVKVTKDTEPNPDTLYGKSKLAAEKSLLKLETPTFSVAIIRPPMVYGKGCKGNYTRLVKLAKLVPIFPNIKNKRSMIAISNICEFLRLLIRDGERGYFFPQDNETVETSQFVKIIWKNIGKNGLLLNLGKPLSNVIRSGFAGKCSSLQKMFGDFYYEKEMSNYYNKSGIQVYIVTVLEEEVKKD